ncbi:MAG TPA: hypothetical protein VK646_04195 [Actinomycetota bacterium]|nr:hypothetical protein [Actinomycetota bacterium]
MPTFDTPGPIAVSLELGVGDIDIIATDRTDTIVDVRPADPAQEKDVVRARQTRVEFANGTLLVKPPKGWRYWAPWGGQGAIDVRIDVPTASTVRGSAGVGALRCTGRLGACRFRTGVGEITIERAAAVEVHAGAGDVRLGEIEGRADVKTAGAISIERIDGPAAIKNSFGDTWIGEITGEGRINAANGAISVDLAGAGVVAKTANGNVRLDEVVGGSVVAQTGLGSVRIGVRDGVPAWLDLQTKFGHVRNDLAEAQAPEAGEDAVEITAHTAMGDIAVHRSSMSSSGKDAP